MFTGERASFRRNLAAFFCVYARRVAAVAVVVGAVTKSSEKAAVKRFCEKNFTEFLSDLKKWSAFFISPHYLGKN